MSLLLMMTMEICEKALRVDVNLTSVFSLCLFSNLIRFIILKMGHCVNDWQSGMPA